MDLKQAHRHAREKGTHPAVYWCVRAALQPFFHLYFRFRRYGREHIPASGPVILVANHRSFSDAFFLGLGSRRPMRFMAKVELFSGPVRARLLLWLGAFPVRRGERDADAMETARLLLARGEVVAIFPEGTRVRPGPLGQPKRGAGRLALETQARVVPAAISGTEAIRRGWIVRPRRVRVRYGRPLTFPRVENPSAHLAGEVVARIWPCVELQWEWLGGCPPLRRVAVIGAGSWGTAVAALLARGGADVQLGCRTPEQAETLRRSRLNGRYLPGSPLPAGVDVRAASEVELETADLLCLAVPSASLPTVVADLAGRQLPPAVLVLSKGLVAPHGTLPSDLTAARLGGPAVAVLGGPARRRPAWRASSWRVRTPSCAAALRGASARPASPARHRPTAPERSSRASPRTPRAWRLPPPPGTG